MQTEKKECFSFRQMVTVSSKVTLMKKIGRASRIKRITMEFPDGEDGDLKIKIWATDDLGSPINLINIIGENQFLSGNDSKLDFNVDIPLRNYSTIYVEGENVDLTYEYPILVSVEVEYYG